MIDRRRVAGKRLLIREELVQHEADGENIARLIDRFSRDLLG